MISKKKEKEIRHFFALEAYFLKGQGLYQNKMSDADGVAHLWAELNAHNFGVSVEDAYRAAALENAVLIKNNFYDWKEGEEHGSH